ncbi:MAG: hypothetical protein K2X43_02405 [Hyphomonadaceae bacterium]|nr:hypothetical protein [Hyphomonadaceae bacterium]
MTGRVRGLDAQGKRACRAAIAAEALVVLTRLAHKGAYATFPGDAADACAIYSPRNGFADPIWHATRPAIAHGLRKGWLVPGETGAVLHICATGLRALRAAKSAASGTAGRCAPQRSEAATLHQAASEGALAWLRRRKDKDGRRLITEVQYDAGEMLAADFWHGQMSPRVTADWSAVAPARRMRRATPGVGVDMRDKVVAARQRLRRALEAVGPELAGILIDVCCHDVGLEAAGQAAGWPQRAARVVLDLALTRLARHYGLLAPERPAAQRLRHWGDVDYRPTLEAWR